MSNDNAAREKELREMEASQPPDAVIRPDKRAVNKRIANVAGAVLLALAVVAVFIAKNNKAEATTGDRPQEIAPAEIKPAERVEYKPEPQPEESQQLAPQQITDEEVDTRRQELEAKLRELAEAEKLRQARLKSPMLIGFEHDPRATAAGDGKSPPTAQEAQSLGRDSNSMFFADNIGKKVPTNTPYQIDNLEYKILQGKYIPLIVDPRAISDLAGQVCARVTEDVYGVQGREKLIPWGSQACGIYRAEIKKGQTRVFIVWNRLVREDGLAINIDSPGVDQLGTAGMGGEVDNHFWQIFGNALMISIIGTGASTAGVGGQDNYNSASMARDSAREAFSETATSILGEYANIPPTIITKAGSSARIYVRGDLDFSRYYLEPQDNGTGDVAAQAYFDN